MCDYSLSHYPNRLARNGEELLVAAFFSGSRGFISTEPVPSPPRPRHPLFSRAWFRQIFGPHASPSPTVVCIAPGARLQLQDVPRLWQRQMAVGPVAEVTFLQRGLDAGVYRDAVRFGCGTVISVQSLPLKMRAMVVSTGDEGEPEQRDMWLEPEFASAER